MSTAYSLIIEAGNLAATVLLLLEVASIKQTVRRADNIEHQGSATINLIKSWVT